MTFERLVRDDRFASRVVTVAVGALNLPRPATVVVADAKRNRAKTREQLSKAHIAAVKAGKATLIHEPALPFPGLGSTSATDVLPDFCVVAPREDDSDRTWLLMGDAKDYERVRSRIADARLLKGFLQVAFGAEAADQWSDRPESLDVHRFGVLAVPKNAFLQPHAVVEDLHDHRIEVRARLEERQRESAEGKWQPSTDPIEQTAYLAAAFDPATCPSCSLFGYCRSELRSRDDPESLLVELGIPPGARPHLIGLASGAGEVSAAAPREFVSVVEATVRGSAGSTGQCRIDPANLPHTLNVVLVKSDSAALGVHGLGIQMVTPSGRGEWEFRVFDNPQSPATRLAVVRALGAAIQASTEAAGESDAADSVHVVVPDKATGDTLSSIADALAGVELSRLRWERDLEAGREALTFDGGLATIPDPLLEDERTGVSFLLEEDRARALSLRTPVVDLRSVLARHVLAGGPAVNSLRLDYLVEWATANAPIAHRALADTIEASVHAPGARLTNARSDEIHSALVGRTGRRTDPDVPSDRPKYDALVREELDYRAATLEGALDALATFSDSRLRDVYREIERDAQAVWRRRRLFHASDLVRFGRTYRWWRDNLVSTIEADRRCHDQLLALTNGYVAETAAADAGSRHVATACVVSTSPLILEVSSRSLVAGSTIVLLHVNGTPEIEERPTAVKIQASGFRIAGLAIGPLVRDAGLRDAPRGHLRWVPHDVPPLEAGDILVVANYDWFRTYKSERYVTVGRPTPDTIGAPGRDCQPGDFKRNPSGHQWCCKPHEASEAEWSDELSDRRARGALNPETWPPVEDEDGFDVIAEGDPVGDPTASPPEAPPDDLTLDDLE